MERTTVVIKSGHMLGTPVDPPLLATQQQVAVKMRAVREISRKGSDDVPSENPQRLYARRCSTRAVMR